MLQYTMISFPLDVRYFSFADNNFLKSAGGRYWSYRIQSDEIQLMFNTKAILYKKYKIEKYPTKCNATTL